MRLAILSLTLVLLAGCTTVPSSAAANEPTTVNASDAKVKTYTLPTQSSSSILSCPSKRVDYYPVPALPTGGYTVIGIDAAGKPQPSAKNWPDKAEDVNKLLTNISTDISMSELGGSVSGGPIFSGSHSSKQYVIDFMKYRVEPLTTTDGTDLGWVRVGAGLRVVVDITKDDGSASGSLIALAISAKADKVAGSMSVELIGMDSKEATSSMPFTVDLSEGNIQKVIETLAIVKTKLYDGATTLYPNLIARMECAALTRR